MTAFDAMWDTGTPDTGPTPQTLAARLMEVKAEAMAITDRHQAAFHAEMRRHLENVQQQVASDVPDDLFVAVETAHQALLKARRDAATARQDLDQHDRARPGDAVLVKAWAKGRGELTDELSAYESIAADAQAAYERAQQQVNTALHGAWQKRRATAQQTFDRRNADVARELDARMKALNDFRASAQTELLPLAEAVAYWDRYR